MTEFPPAVSPRLRHNARAICALMDIPYEYATGMTMEAEGLAGEEAFATLTITLKRKLSREEWEAIVEVANDLL